MSDTLRIPNAFENLAIMLEEAKNKPAPIVEATRSDKTVVEHSTSPTSSSKGSNSNILETSNRISARSSASFKPSSSKQKFSKRINLSLSNEHVAAVCDYTGAVVAITFPAIPGRVFSYSSPLADLRNARGLAQEGSSYLRKLDIQTVAAILITLADDYSLFRYQPSDSGAQKNAILRTVAKDILIDAILFVEDFVNSNNSGWIPKLSLILTGDILQSGIQHRMSEWLKVALDAVYKPDTETYEEAVTVKKSGVKPVTTVATKRAAVALQKEFRQWKREAKDIIISLAASSTISPKLKGFLINIIADQNILLADPVMLELICERLKQLGDTRTNLLAKNIAFYRAKLVETEASEFDKPTEDTFSSKLPGTAIQPMVEAEDNEFAAPTAIPTATTTAEKPMSFKERIAFLRAQNATVPVSNNKPENDDAPF